MDYEKKYKDALTWVGSIYPKLSHEHQMEAEAFFPELKGNEYESTRKRIISLVNAHGQGRFKESMLAWLEKLKVFTEHGDGLYHFANSEFTYVGNPTWDNVSFLEKQGQKSAWSEEDMSKVQRICKYLNEAKKYYADITEVRECMDWLKYIENRIKGG